MSDQRHKSRDNIHAAMFASFRFGLGSNFFFEDFSAESSQLIFDEIFLSSSEKEFMSIASR